MLVDERYYRIEPIRNSDSTPYKLTIKATKQIEYLFNNFDYIICKDRIDIFEYDINTLLNSLKEKSLMYDKNYCDHYGYKCFEKFKIKFKYHDTTLPELGFLYIKFGSLCVKFLKQFIKYITKSLDDYIIKWNQLCFPSLEERCQYILRLNKQVAMEQIMRACGITQEQFESIKQLQKRAKLI